MKHTLYTQSIDASKWLIFEHIRDDNFDDHAVCMKAGYTWNGIISGSFNVYPDGKVTKPELDNETEMGNAVYCWYPIK